MASWCSAAIPMPLSRTSMRSRLPSLVGLQAASTVPRSVCRKALLTRLSRMRCSRRGSLQTHALDGRRRSPFSCAALVKLLRKGARTLSIGNANGSTGAVPESSCEMSKNPTSMSCIARTEASMPVGSRFVSSS